MANETMDSAAVEGAMANIYRLRPAKDQFTRWAESIRWFQPRQLRHRGESYFWKVFTQPYTGVRRTKTGQESEFPAARQQKWEEFTLDKDDIPEFQGSGEYTGLAKEKTRSREDAVVGVAEKLVMGMDQDFAVQVNVSVHQTSTCEMALVAATYDNDGTAYSGGTATTAFIQIDGGSIAQFVKGQILDIRQASATASPRCTVKVDDVFYDSEGPQGVDDIGPGINVEVTASGVDAHLDNVVDGDEIVLNGEVASNLTGFPSWFGQTNTVMGKNRQTVGNGWTVPLIKSYLDGSGNPVTFSFDEHLVPAAEDLSFAVRAGRQMRAVEEADIKMTGALVALTTPRILSEAVQQAGDPVRFNTTLALKLPEATRRELWGDIGFDGTVWHHPNMPPIALQQDPVATLNTLRLLEPSSFFWITAHEGGIKQPERLKSDGRWFRYQQGSNGRMVNKLIAGALMRIELGCDQPRANYEISGVKSSTQ